ncbi:hypothetical protein QWJ34_00980 [Saccharibacillus sp. CPCC 101409]|uniref:hypothetical protein n=1 Tax=Saccharibacillus sp. CPCC 101409 TaxID=3058041 RepID=UPI00267409B5|nr:hypothetical protein [Saccharibacillus sp. CPCC 101409]MDO3408333.1 hypothetical protein [Saccharibacillus sp. CPCC 101409]
MQTIPSAGRRPAAKPPWVRDKKRFRLAVILAFLLMLSSLRYPGVRPLYEEALLAMRLPLSVSFPGSVHFNHAGLTFCALVIWTLYLYWTSLRRHRILFGLVAVWILPMLCGAILTGFQTLIAPGVYAVAVDTDRSGCTIKSSGSQNSETVSGNCSFAITNHARQAVHLTSSARLTVEDGDNGSRTIEIPLEDMWLDRHTSTLTGGSFNEAPLQQDEESNSYSFRGYSFNDDELVLILSDGKRERILGVRNAR